MRKLNLKKGNDYFLMVVALLYAGHVFLEHELNATTDNTRKTIINAILFLAFIVLWN
jgi:hypothetical protein